jgi:hypothetical protein
MYKFGFKCFKGLIHVGWIILSVQMTSQLIIRLGWTTLRKHGLVFEIYFVVIKQFFFKFFYSVCLVLYFVCIS